MTPTSEPADGISRALFLRLAVYQSLHELSLDTSLNLLVLFPLWILDLSNLLLLPLGPSFVVNWESSVTMSGLRSTLLQWLWFWNHKEGAAVGYDWQALYITISVWMCLSISAFAWTACAHMGWTRYNPHWLAVAQRASARVAIHGLWGTIIMNLVDPFVCSGDSGSTWRASGLACWTGGHAALLFLSVVLSLSALTLHVLLALTFINREPDYTGSSNLLGAPHGRVDVFMLLLKTILALVYVFSEGSVVRVGYLILITLAGVAWMYAYITYQPYYRGWLNSVQVCLAAVYLSACACAAMASAMNTAMGWEVSAVAYLYSTPLLVFACWAGNAMVQRQYKTGVSIFTSSPLEVATPYAVELRSRAIILDAIRQQADPRVLTTSKAGENYYAEQNEKATDRTTLLASDRDVRTRDRGVGLMSSGQPTAAHDAQAAEHVREHIADLWKEARKVFGHNSLFHLILAHHQSQMTRSAYLERAALRQAVQYADWTDIDVHFFAWSRNHALEAQAQADGATKMNVELRLRYENILADSRAAVSRARARILDFWTELGTASPELGKLQEIGRDIHDSTLFIEDLYRRHLLSLAPSNPSILREYASFLLEIANRPGSAAEVLSEAEDAEAEQSKQRSMGGRREHSFGLAIQDFDLAGDSVGTLHVSSDRATLGVVLDCSPAAARLAGYSHRELIGRNLSDLIPQPIGQAHNAIMDRFLEVGMTRFLGVGRLTFLLHRAGYIVPARLAVQATGQDFHAVLDAAVTPPGEAYIWCLGSEQGWVVTAVCEVAMSMLGTDAACIKAGHISLSTYAEDLHTAMAEVSKGGTAKVDLQAARSGGAPTCVSMRGQHVVIPAIGVGLWMLRVKKIDSGGGQLSNVPSKLPVLAGAGTRARSASASTASSEEANDGDSSRHSSDGTGSGSHPHNSAAVSLRAHSGSVGSRDMSACPVMSQQHPLSTQGEQCAGTGIAVSSNNVPPQPRPAATSQLGSGGDLNVDLLAMVDSTAPTETGGSYASSAASHRPLLTHARHGTSDDPLPGQGGTGSKESSIRGSYLSFNRDPQVFGSSVLLTSGSSLIVNSDGLALPKQEPAGEGEGRGQVGQAEEIHFHARRGKKQLVLQVPDGRHSAATSSVMHQRRFGENVLRRDSAGMAPSIAVHGEEERWGAATSSKSGMQATMSPAQGRGEYPAAPASVHSKGSASSSRSGGDALRRGVLSRAATMEASLVTLRWALGLAFVISAVLNLVALLVTQELIQQMYRNLVLVEMNGARAILAQRLYSQVQSMRAASIGLADPVNMTLARARNNVYLTEYTKLNNELYLAVDGSLPEEKDLYTNASAITVLDFVRAVHLIPGFDDFPSKPRTTNLANGAVELATRMRSVLAMAGPDIRFTDPAGNVFWLAANGPNALSEAMHRSIMLSDQRSATQGGRIKRTDLIILVVAESVLVLVICVAIVPSVLSVSRAKHAVFDTFILVPLPVIRALRASVQKRMEELAAAEADSDDTAVQVAGHDEDGVPGIASAPGPGMGMSKLEEEEDGDGRDASLTAAVNAAVNNADNKSPRGKTKKRKYRRSISGVALILVSFIWPVMAYMGYFAVMWWHKGTVVDHAAADRAQLLWSAQVEIYVRRAALRLRFAYQFCGVDYVHRQLDMAEQFLSFTELLVNQLLYGAQERNLPPALQEGNKRYNDLWLGNACFEDQSWYYSMEDCRAFRSGLMTRGLLGVVASYADVARKLITDRRVLVSLPACVRENIEEAGTPKRDLSHLNERYLASGFALATEIQFRGATEFLQRFMDAYRGMVGATVAVLPLIFLFLYVPQIKRLDREMKNVRMLLLLFPDEVARALPCIVAASKQLSKGAGYSTALGGVISAGTPKQWQRTA